MAAVRLPDQVRSERLTLRRWQHADAASLGAIVEANLDHLRPWMAWIAAEPLTTTERVHLIERWTQDWERGGDAMLGVFHEGEAIGSCGLHRRGAPNELEIGYWIAANHTRLGFATELTRALTDAALDVDGIDRVLVVTDEANIASAGVPEGLGFTREGIDVRTPVAPGETGRMIVWSTATPTRGRHA